MFVLVLVLVYLLVDVLFDVSAEIFGGEQVVPFGDIFGLLFKAALRTIAIGLIPGVLFYGLIKFGADFEESV